MNNIKFYKGENTIPLSINNGNFYLFTDTHEIYYDLLNSRHKITNVSGLKKIISNSITIDFDEPETANRLGIGRLSQMRMG